MATASAAATPQIATTFLSSSTFLLHTRSSSYSYNKPYITTSSLPSFSPIITTTSSNSIIPFQRKSRLWSIPATATATAEDAAVDAAEQLVSTTDDGASVVISALFFVAFIGLSVITIGVIYLAVTDFLQKREKDKFEKEEAAKSGKKKKKRVVRARAGPRGFGQKIDENENDD